MGKILVVGSLNVDMVMNVDHMPAEGETILCDGMTLVPGGKGANQACAAGRLGTDVAMLGAIGDDDYGALQLKSLSEAGVEVGGLLKKEGQNTGTAFITVNKSGNNSIVVVPGANSAFRPEDIEANRELIEQQLSALPLAQYGWIETAELEFSERIRRVCEQECPMYGKTWACPPAVGTVEECRARCLSYPHALYLTTLTEVSDIANLDETLATRAPHEAVTREALAILKPHVKDVMALSTEACAICEHCAYPDAPCRHPELMFPCVESHGIIVTALAEKEGSDFYGGNLVTWFSLLLFHE